MEEQVSIIVTVLAALLTGGFLMIFIESQQVANNMAERFHFIRLCRDRSVEDDGCAAPRTVR